MKRVIGVLLVVAVVLLLVALLVAMLVMTIPHTNIVAFTFVVVMGLIVYLLAGMLRASRR